MNTNASRHPLRFTRKSLSLSRRGAWGQVAVAALLITILPLLILAWGWKSHLDGATLPPEASGAPALSSCSSSCWDTPCS